MMWHVQYRKDATSHVVRHPSPERAIEAACRLIDDGCDVYGVGIGPLTDSIGRVSTPERICIGGRSKNASRPDVRRPRAEALVGSASPISAFLFDQ
jgi:hypothetical protein